MHNLGQLIRRKANLLLVIAMALILVVMIPIAIADIRGGDGESERQTEAAHPEAAPLEEHKTAEQFFDDLGARNVDSVIIDEGRRQAVVVPKDGQAYAFELTNDQRAQIVGELLAANIDHEVLGKARQPVNPLVPIAVLVLIGAVAFFIIRKAGGLAGGGSKARAKQATIPTTRFSDVAGIETVLEEVGEVVEFLENPTRYLAAGAKMPKGILLAGDPGVGKTLLARAVAGEAGVPFYSASGSEFVEMYVGVGASRIRSLFNEATKQGKAIVFVDEIDSLGRRRSSNATNGGSAEYEQTLNQLLTHMDGFDQRSGVVVIAATNRPDLLDPALTRKGRFDRTITVPKPDRPARRKIFGVHTADKTLHDDVRMDVLVSMTAGFSGADIANLCNEAAINAARNNRTTISMADFNDALQRVVIGPEKKSAEVLERENHLVAVHEAGHAVMARKTGAPDPTLITIVSRGNTGGVTYSPSPEGVMRTRSYFLDQLVMCMGGRVAEMWFLGEDYTQGACSDLQKATEVAHVMVTQYGMAPDLGLLTFTNDETLLGPRSQDIALAKKKLLDEAFDRAQRLFHENLGLAQDLIMALLEQETMDAAALETFWEEHDPHHQPEPDWPSLQQRMASSDRLGTFN